jgi:hypothetical protein
MKLKVTEQGVMVPKAWLGDAEEVEIRQEQGGLMMVPVALPRQKRVAGLHPGAMQMSDDFDAPLPDEFHL